jgi:monoamine oxidase
MNDYIIVGGGIAGLYSAYQIKKKQPEAKFIILERNRKGYLGGRTGNEIFEGTQVVTGAGIGRKKKDKILIHVLRELGIKYHEFPTGAHYSYLLGPHCQIKSIFLELRKKYNHKQHSNLTFKQYATTLLTHDQYQYFLMCAGYTDFENQSAHDTLYNYGFEDNYSDWIGLGIDWGKLVETLAKHIGVNNIHYSENVLKIHKTSHGFMVETKTSQYQGTKIIVATTIEPLKKMLPRHTIYKQIHSQPFIRLYGKFSKSSISLMKTYVSQTTIVPGPIHKIIPMNPDHGVYMIAYSDNEGATLLNQYAKNTNANREQLARLVEASLGMPKNMLELESIVDYYWKEGTHYYEPLRGQYIEKGRDAFIKAAQHPEPNMWVVGEMVSKHQGWVEGALESVHEIIGEVLHR